jgi:hypothetical protein
MKRKMNIRYPLWLALMIYWLLIFALLSASLMKTNGHFGYPLDDTYIHMAIGKHLTNDGFWGVSTNGFSSSTSSPLWTFLIAITYKTFGINDWTPFILCLLMGSLMIVYIYYLLQKISNPIRQTAYLVFIILFTPLPVLTLIGMEHVLQSLITISLIYLAAAFLTGGGSNSRGLPLLMLLAGLATITRYEGIFLVFPIVVLFLIKRRFLAAFLIGAAGLLTITVYGIFSMIHGWYFFPNSVLLKGNMPNFRVDGVVSFLLHLPANLVAAPHGLVLLIACLVIYLAGGKQKVIGEKKGCLMAIFVPMTLFHMQFAAIGWFYRYEAYIVLAGSVILVDMLDAFITEHPVKFEIGEIFNYVAVFTLLILFVTPLALRAGQAFRDYPMTVKNIYEQQYQMGLFLGKYYSGKSVAVNDIGAIDYLADVKTLDLSGLASMEVARAKMNGSFDKETIKELALMHNVEVLVIYTSWFEGKIPPDWREIGRWTITGNVVCADAVVTFYAPGARWEKDVTTHLEEFSGSLPSSVGQSGKYITP